jgi:uncharacterized protein (TIGR02391 family)
MGSTNEKISTLRLRLRQKNNAADFHDIIVEIGKLGPDGVVLIPDLIRRIESGTCPTTISLVPLIVLHKNGELLKAAIKCWQHTGQGLNQRDKATLFAAGFHQFQEELIDYLRDSFDRDSDPFRTAIVDAFSKSGTTGLTEDLEGIAILCERRLKELKRPKNSLSLDEQIDRKSEADLREDFLKRLRKAIDLVRLRPNLPPLDKPDLPIKVDGGTEGDKPDNATSVAIVSDPPSEWDHLHPEVVRHASGLLKSGHKFHAVFEAAKAYDKKVATMAAASEHGESLMNKAFGNHGAIKLTRGLSETDRNIQDGIRSLSAGLMRAIRNPTAHEPAADWPMSRVEAMEILGLISFLFRQLDKATGMSADSTGGDEIK